MRGTTTMRTPPRRPALAAGVAAVLAVPASAALADGPAADVERFEVAPLHR
jgi:hypothetical protein